MGDKTNGLLLSLARVIGGGKSDEVEDVNNSAAELHNHAYVPVSAQDAAEADVEWPTYNETTHSLSDEVRSTENPKTQYGLRKPPLHLIPSTALVLIAEAHRLGAKKYGAYNWRETKVEAMTYLGAALRHIHAFLDGEEIDTDPQGGTHHLAHAAACLNILLDASACGTLIDDRPAPAPTGQMIAERTQPI